MTFLYRKSSGEVVSANTRDDLAYGSAIESAYFAAVVNPAAPNGTDLAVPKVFDGSVLRNATAPEIAAFAAAANSDDTMRARGGAVSAFQTDPALRKILRAIVGLTVQQINTLRTQPTTTFSALTEAQVFTAIVNAINAGTYD
ncbi:MAG TPA: hypothetical protein VN903_25785 [Polyangia bacterium]|nr:hypothetical protein [Polyangia bacterium]